MKTGNFFQLIALIALVILFSCKNKNILQNSPIKDSTTIQKTDSKGKYAIKSGIVVYKTNIMDMEQQQTLTFDDYGNKEATVIEMEMMGVEVTNYTISKDGYVYSFDNDKKTGRKIPVMTKGSVDYQNLTSEYMEKMNIKKEGTETISGKICNKYSINNDEFKLKGFFWVWNGIAMKTDMDMGGMKMKMEAVKLEENPTVPATTFDIPANIKFE